MSPSPKEQQALEAVLERASVDRAFREELLADPQRAIEREFGVAVPPGFRLKFVERGSDVDALVVLPDVRGDAAAEPPAAEEGVLSDDELEQVAGGQGGHNTWARTVQRNRPASHES